jgi:PPK2 family polyphosphate:nucleotide phosphotransferase
MSSLREALRLPSGPVDLASIDTRATPLDPGGKDAAPAAMAEQGEALDKLQEQLFAEATVLDSPRRVLVVLQGMDTSGKDGVIRHGLEGMNPSWMHAHSFGPPTEEELAHHFLWRVRNEVPPAGYVGVFDRSHYEDVLVVRVRELVPEEVWRPRYDEINAFERELTEAGVTILKVFLHISRDYQLERQLRRLDRPDKRWKFDASDIEDRKHWVAYQAAYEEAMERCSAVPWHVVPADRKWYRQWAVGRLLLETLQELDPRFPERPELDLPALRAELERS